MDISCRLWVGRVCFSVAKNLLQAADQKRLTEILCGGDLLHAIIE